jgi:hypothetical protein
VLHMRPFQRLIDQSFCLWLVRHGAVMCGVFGDIAVLLVGQQPNALYRAATPGVFPALRLPLRRGRLFDERDRDDRPLVVLVSDAFAQKFFPGADPLGQRLSFGDHKTGEPKNGPPSSASSATSCNAPPPASPSLPSGFPPHKNQTTS